MIWRILDRESEASADFNSITTPPPLAPSPTQRQGHKVAFWALGDANNEKLGLGSWILLLLLLFAIYLPVRPSARPGLCLLLLAFQRAGGGTSARKPINGTAARRVNINFGPRISRSAAPRGRGRAAPGARGGHAHARWRPPLN